MFNDKYCENCNFATSYEFNKKNIYEKSVKYFIFYSQQEFQKLKKFTRGSLDSGFKLESITELPNNIEEEWETDWTEEGPENIVIELQTTNVDQQKSHDIDLIQSIYDLSRNKSVYSFEASRLIVRPEEAFIVIFVLLLWIGAIALFFHRWGKIRMLEPYTPKYEAEHRPSCVLVDPITKRMSVSHKLSIPLTMTSFQCNSLGPVNTSLYGRGYPLCARPRQNSVFVGAHILSPPQPPRKTKSAMDIHSLILSEEASEAV